MKNFNSTNSIKNIIFDFGGVIIDIDFNRTIERFKNLGAGNFAMIYGKANQVNLFDRLDRGEVDPEAFRKELCSITGLDIPDRQIDNAWNAMLLEVSCSRLQLLEKVRKNYNTYLLSNTNAIHMETFRRMLYEKYGIYGIENFFDRAYLSYLSGMRKPELRIFRLVIEDNNLNPSETLFIDDSVQHINSASGLGIKTYLFKPEKENLEDLFENGILKNSSVNDS